MVETKVSEATETVVTVVMKEVKAFDALGYRHFFRNSREHCVPQKIGEDRGCGATKWNVGHRESISIASFNIAFTHISLQHWKGALLADAYQSFRYCDRVIALEFW